MVDQAVADETADDFDYDPNAIKEIDYKERLMDFLTRWCARCQNREPMTQSDVAANDFAIKMQTWLDTGEWPDDQYRYH